MESNDIFNNARRHFNNARRLKETLPNFKLKIEETEKQIRGLNRMNLFGSNSNSFAFNNQLLKLQQDLKEVELMYGNQKSKVANEITFGFSYGAEYIKLLSKNNHDIIYQKQSQMILWELDSLLDDVLYNHSLELQMVISKLVEIETTINNQTMNGSLLKHLIEKIKMKFNER